MLPYFETRNNPISFIKGIRSEFPPHFHKEVELFCVTDGVAEVDIAGNRKKLYSGEIAVIFPNEIHEYIGNSNNKHVTLIFDPIICPDFFAVFTGATAKNPFITNVEQYPDLKDAFLNLLSVLSSRSESSGVLIKGHLTILLYHILNSISVEKNSSLRNPDIVAQVINYVSAHYLEQMSLESISLALGYSKYEISRVFSKKLCIHFNVYLNSLRTEHALALLKDTSKPITEIAFASGFESLRTFYRVFSKKYKISPMKYRMNINI